MAALVIAEHDNASIKGATLNTVSAALACGGEVHVLVAGANAGAAAQAAAQIAGVSKVLHADAAGLDHGLAENVAANAALQKTVRHKSNITPMSGEPSSVLATFQHLIATYPIRPETNASAVAPVATNSAAGSNATSAAPPTNAAEPNATPAPAPTVFVSDLFVPSTVTVTHPPVPRPSFTVTVPTPVPSPVKSFPRKPVDEPMDDEAAALFAPQPDDGELPEMTPQEVDKEFEIDPESSDGPSDDEDDNAGNVTVTSLELDDDDDAEMQDEERVP